jgi:hypothetical protein
LASSVNFLFPAVAEWDGIGSRDCGKVNRLNIAVGNAHVIAVRIICLVRDFSGATSLGKLPHLHFPTGLGIGEYMALVLNVECRARYLINHTTNDPAAIFGLKLVTLLQSPPHPAANRGVL